MEEAGMAKAEAIRRAYTQAKEMRAEGVPADIIEDAIKKKLIESGLEPAAAVIICGNLPGVRPEPEDDSAQGRKNIIIGAGLIVFGILVTWVSGFFAIKKGWGYYVITLGPIFAGLGMFVKDVFDYKSRL
ncbi:MAG: hypothetical protein L6416_00570 [Candidatus Omnitrophica bacterium]|nr:hypothetical protein [Candidatus Omnitrophota bacterium]